MLIVNSKIVRILMIEKDIPTVEALGKLCQPPMHANTIYQVLRGDRWNSETVERLAKALGVPALSLIQEIDDTLPPRQPMPEKAKS